jgi:hypothetical protein
VVNLLLTQFALCSSLICYVQQGKEIILGFSWLLTLFGTYFLFIFIFNLDIKSNLFPLSCI